MIKPHLAPGAVLVYDEIHWSSGMERAWAAIAADPDLCVIVDLTSIGIAVLGSDTKRAYRYHLRAWPDDDNLSGFMGVTDSIWPVGRRASRGTDGWSPVAKSSMG